MWNCWVTLRGVILLVFVFGACEGRGYGGYGVNTPVVCAYPCECDTLPQASVCASSGRTFANQCYLDYFNKNGAYLGVFVAKAHDGPCYNGGGSIIPHSEDTSNSEQQKKPVHVFPSPYAESPPSPVQPQPPTPVAYGLNPNNKNPSPYGGKVSSKGSVPPGQSAPPPPPPPSPVQGSYNYKPLDGQVSMRSYAVHNPVKNYNYQNKSPQHYQIYNPIKSTTTTTPATTVPPAVTTPPPVTTTLPPVTTTLPPVTTTLPPVITTLPPVTTTLPPVITTLPPVVTTLPPIETTLPPLETTLPPPETTLPPLETTLPPLETTLPPLETTLPPTEVTTLPPTETTLPPFEMTTLPTDLTTPLIRFLENRIVFQRQDLEATTLPPIPIPTELPTLPAEITTTPVPLQTTIIFTPIPANITTLKPTTRRVYRKPVPVWGGR